MTVVCENRLSVVGKGYADNVIVDVEKCGEYHGCISGLISVARRHSLPPEIQY